MIMSISIFISMKTHLMALRHKFLEKRVSDFRTDYSERKKNKPGVYVQYLGLRQIKKLWQHTDIEAQQALSVWV